MSWRISQLIWGVLKSSKMRHSPRSRATLRRTRRTITSSDSVKDGLLQISNTVIWREGRRVASIARRIGMRREGSGSIVGWMPQSASSCCGWHFRSNLISRIRKWYKHIWGKVHGSQVKSACARPSCRTGVQLRPTSEQALASQYRFFDIFYRKFKVSREHILVSVLHYNSSHL